MTGFHCFRVSREGDALVVALEGSIGSLAEVEIHEELEAVLRRIDAERVRRVVVDFADVAYFGSMLLEALRVLWNRLESDGGRLVLCNLSNVGREVLEVTKFDALWPICDSRAAALAALHD